MSYNSQQVKAPTLEKGKTLVKVGTRRPIDNRIVFSFSFFQGESIIIDNFNNFYMNQEDSIKAVSDFFQTIKEISNYPINIFFSPATKVQFHYNEFADNHIIDRIEKVLIEGYNMPKKKVEEFERLYFEFSFSNGKRAIGTKIYDNIFEILFLDSNHMICLQSSRNVKFKMMYSFPSCFSKMSNDILNIKEISREDLIEMLFDSVRKGSYNNFSELIKDYEDLFSKV